MTSPMDLTPVRSVTGMTDDELLTVNALLATWWRKRGRNALREQYYSAHNRLRDLGIAVPPPLRKVETYVGWPAKAVDAMANRAVFEGYTFQGTDTNIQLDAVVGDCDFVSAYSQAVTDALVSSCSFLCITKGGFGEPDVIASAHSARDGAAIWDYRLNRIKCGMVVADVRRNSSGRVIGPALVNVFTRSETLVLRWNRNGRWVLEARESNPHGVPLMEAVRYAPRLGRPFGKSRISRPVMAITDSAVREALRSEVAAEFVAAPQKYIMGATDDIFDDKTKWEAYMGSFLALGLDENGERMQVGQFPQGSMQSHTEYMRDLAARFSGETGVPVSSLGVIHDNPSSAEAIYAAKEDLVIEASNFNRDNRSALRRIGLLMMAVAQGVAVGDLTDADKTIQPRFMNPSLPSVVSQSDAMVQQIGAIPWIGESRVALEQLGYDDAQIMRLMSDKKRAQANAVVASLVAPKEAPVGDTAQDVGSANDGA
ncbi:MAG: phage portal protein [Gordonibacter sp.]|uniref:phage portal protein n=1 Tax=Gordonibacter sp. TaxID=1968902 RepID=UPI002FC8B666